MIAFATRLYNWIATLRGWRGKLACFVAGAATAAGFAPFYAWPVIFLTLPFLFLMLDKARHPRSAALYAWAFGYGHMMAGTYWIAHALAVDKEQFGWLIPISILGLSLVMGLWFALFGALYRWLRRGNTAADLLRFAVLWIVVEYLRSLGIFGFPWNLMGSMALASERVAQLMAVWGTYGMGFVLVWIAVLPVLWLRRDSSELFRQRVLIGVLVAAIAVYAYGMVRMPTQAPLSDTRIRIVQGNIAQSLKWTEAGRAESARIYGSLSRMVTEAPPPDIIVWPETAIPFTLRPDTAWAADLAGLAPPGGALLSGAVRSMGEGEDYRLFNSIVVVDGAGEAATPYDKHQLVPFGEFVPFRRVLPLEKITAGSIDFSRGEGVRTVQVGDLPSYRPLVCYEIIFPWLSHGGERPEWLVNATNDAWYGISPGPFQHFDAARLRAIEQGLPVVRAANTGISAVIDPYGRSVRQLALNERGVVDQALPRPLEPTPYARWGEILTIGMLVGAWLLSRTRYFRQKK